MFFQSTNRRTNRTYSKIERYLTVGNRRYGQLLREMCTSLQEQQTRKVIVHAEKIFRGKLYPMPVEIYSVSYKPDYRLIPKDEEQLWWDRLANCKPRERIVPGLIELPPLMKVCDNYLNCPFESWIFIEIHVMLIVFQQLLLERDNKDSDIKLPLEIRGNRDNVAQSDLSILSSYKPSFFKNQQSN